MEKLHRQHEEFVRRIEDGELHASDAVKLYEPYRTREGCWTHMLILDFTCRDCQRVMRERDEEREADELRRKLWRVQEEYDKKQRQRAEEEAKKAEEEAERVARRKRERDEAEAREAARKAARKQRERERAAEPPPPPPSDFDKAVSKFIWISIIGLMMIYFIFLLITSVFSAIGSAISSVF